VIRRDAIQCKSCAAKHTREEIVINVGYSSDQLPNLVPILIQGHCPVWVFHSGRMGWLRKRLAIAPEIVPRFGGDSIRRFNCHRLTINLHA
jgi:hypothetical protein